MAISPISDGADLHFLSGRKDKTATTFSNQLVARMIDAQPTHRIVDIGCGDGSLIASLSCRERIGIVPGREECAMLRREYAHLTDLRFDVGIAQSLPLESASADRVIMNGVLRLLKSLDDINAAIGELARISSKGGLIWIGEVISGNPEARRWSFNIDYLRYASKQRRHLSKRRPIVLPRESVIEITKHHGLLLRWDGPRPYFGNGRTPCPVRRDYLFMRT